MEKPRASLKNMSSIAAALLAGGMLAGNHMVNRGLHYVGFGTKKWRETTSRYKPKDPQIKNPKIAANVAAMHDKWLAMRAAAAPVNKPVPIWNSITNQKLGSGFHRHTIRMRLEAGKFTVNG